MTSIGRIGVAMVIGAVLLLAAATGGASSVVMERPIAIDVVSDDRAAIGVDDRAVSVTNETSQATLIEVENRLGEPIAVSVAHNDGAVLSNTTVENERLEPGESTAVAATVDCFDREAGGVTLVLSAEGDGVSVERSLEVTPCAGDR